MTGCGRGAKAGRPLRGPVCFGHVTIFHGKKSLLCTVLEAKTSGPNYSLMCAFPIHAGCPMCLSKFVLIRCRQTYFTIDLSVYVLG